MALPFWGKIPLVACDSEFEGFVLLLNSACFYLRFGYLSFWVLGLRDLRIFSNLVNM